MTRAVFLCFFLIASFVSAAQTTNRYDVVIDELMPDPSPQVGLPNNEWIELKNTSTIAISLAGWRIGDASSLSGPMPALVLQPDSFVIVCGASAAAAMSAYGRVIPVTNFPSLDNNEDQIILQNAQGRVIHAVEYNVSWYQNSIKEAGGWSLEMIDTKNPCTGIANWKASVDASGGTPGRKNSVDGVMIDNVPPQLLRTYSLDSVTLVSVFNEPIDSTSASMAANYSMGNGITITSATAQPPLFSTVIVRLGVPLQKRTVYTLSVVSVKDCKGNSIGGSNKANAGLPEDAAPLDLVVNEILFNPKSNGADYVEAYNRSNKIIDANKMFVATRNTSGVISSFKNFTDTPFYIYPQEYVVLTEDAIAVQRDFFVPNPEKMLTVSLPSLPDDKGTVVIANAQGNVVDEVTYSEKWHFPLISNAEGISVERVNVDAASQDPGNWHSAASTVGFGTPTYKNSQSKSLQSVQATVNINPKVFSPDNDGVDDIAFIQFNIAGSGYLANVTIFDANGRTVRQLVRNGSPANNGSWNWDGLGDRNEKLATGIYIVYTELFNLDGKKQHFKNTVVLARKL